MSVEEPHHKESESDEIEIRLSDIVQFLKDSRRFIIVGGLIGLIIGAVYAFSKPDVYTSQVTVMPEIQAKGSGNLGGLGSLAGLAGINVDNFNDQDAIRPDLYPTILRSVPFGLYMLKQYVYSNESKKQIPLEYYLSNKNTGWLNVLMRNNVQANQTGKAGATDTNQFVSITAEQDQLIKILHASVSVVYDKKTGILSISAVAQEALVAAKIAQVTLKYLTDYITAYRTEKSRRQVSFLQRQVTEARRRYQTAEYTLSSYRDNNHSIYLNTAKIEEQRLQADYILAQSVYSELSKQLEQAKIKVQDETPIFKTLEPTIVPLQKSGPRRMIIIASFLLGGLLLTIAIRLTQYFMSQINPS